uniref:NB-ARC domain containing protein n=1 Tax=Solanum tuberosum TaxID=4113 RepID=M1DYT0_SOLTU
MLSQSARIKQYTEKSLKPVSLLHGEPMVVFDSKDLETFITEENLKYALIAKFSHGRPELPDLRKILPQQLRFKGECNIGLLESRHVLLRFTLKEDYIAIFSKTSRSIKFAGTVIPFRIQKWTPSFSPMEETSIAMAWISFPSLPCQYFARNALFSMASVVGQPLDVDQATNDKTRPSTARKNEQEALASEFSPTRGYDSDLGDDSFNEDEEENMLDVCFDKVARDGDISPRHQRSGSNENKKKTHGRQHSWDGKVTREFVPRHLPMRQAKQNHTTVSIASTRSNTSKKK